MNGNTQWPPGPPLAQTRREQVLAAAIHCFRRHGYHGASMAEIASTAAMNPGHIYHYFESKEAIIEAILASELRELFCTIRGLRDQPGEPLDAILDGMRASVDKKIATERGVLELEMIGEAARNSKVAAVLRSADALTRQNIRELFTGPRGMLARCDTDELEGRIEVISAIFSGLLIRALMNPSLEREAMIAALRPVLRTALTPGI